MKMSKLGVTRSFTEWLSSWFTNRAARDIVNGEIGPSRTFKEVQPHCSVFLAPLFTIYVKNLLAESKMDAFVSSYAFDLLIVRSARNKDLVVASLSKK